MLFIQRNWYAIGGVVAMGTLGGIALFGSNLSPIQLILAFNFVTLLIHQVEEYIYPGMFPGHWNAGVCRSDQPTNYPLNARSSMIVNFWLGWPIYLAPIFFPHAVWLGLATVLAGFSQVVIHGVVFPIRARRAYSPGIVSAILMFVPVGVAYILEAQPTGSDWIIAIASVPIVVVATMVAPIKLLASKNSQHHFLPRQMGDYAE